MTTADAALAAVPPDPPTPLPTLTVAPVRRIGTSLIASGQIAVHDGSCWPPALSAPTLTWTLPARVPGSAPAIILDAVAAELGTLNSIVGVEKLTVYVASAPQFTDQHLVAHAAGALVLHVLGPDRGRHARAAIGVAALPLGSPVEVDAVFSVEPA